MIERTDDGGVRVLRLSHGKANALDVELLGALAAEARALAGSDARAAVLTGAGPMFCAGLDLKRVTTGGSAYLRALLPALEGAVEALFTCPKPVVAALNGHALAGGFILAACCDRRLMADGDGRVGLPELHVGVPFPTLVLEVLRATVAPAQLHELLLVGGSFRAPEALARQLVDEVVPADRVLEAAVAAARRLGELPARSYAMTKRKLRQDAIDAWRARASGGDREIVETWCAPETLAALERFVATKLK